MSKKFTYKGVTYPSLKSFCDKNGWNYQTFCRLYKKTGSIDETVTHLKAKRYPYFYLEKYYRSLSDLCKDYNIEYNRFYYHYHQQHKSIEDALADSQQTKGPTRRIRYKGVYYSSLLAFCKAHNYSYPVMRKNLESMSFEEAVEKTKDSSGSKRRDALMRSSYKSYVELCKEHGISYWSFMAARQKGLSLEHAIAHCKKRQRNR